MSRYLAATTLLFLIAFSFTAAQINNNVRWTLLTKTLSGKPGSVVSVKVKATLVEKEHLYSFTTLGAAPTECTVRGEWLRLGRKPQANSRPLRMYDENFEDTTEFWEKSVVFTIPVRISASAQPGTVTGNVTFNFMTCNDTRCIPNVDIILRPRIRIQ